MSDSILLDIDTQHLSRDFEGMAEINMESMRCIPTIPSELRNYRSNNDSKDELDSVPPSSEETYHEMEKEQCELNKDMGNKAKEHEQQVNSYGRSRMYRCQKKNMI